MQGIDKRLCAFLHLIDLTILFVVFCLFGVFLLAQPFKRDLHQWNLKVRIKLLYQTVNTKWQWINLKICHWLKNWNNLLSVTFKKHFFPSPPYFILCHRVFVIWKIKRMVWTIQRMVCWPQPKPWGSFPRWICAACSAVAHWLRLSHAQGRKAVTCPACRWQRGMWHLPWLSWGWDLLPGLAHTCAPHSHTERCFNAPR